MRKTVLLLIALAALFGATWAFAGPPGLPATGNGNQSERVRQGVSHFEKAFYQLAPQKREAEADHEYDQAIAAFRAELATQPSSATAHAYLARIYFLRGQFPEAAAHYDKLTELDPRNIDAYVLAALAFAEHGQLQEARDRLITAKTQTADPEVVRRLDGYLAKLPTPRP